MDNIHAVMTEEHVMLSDAVRSVKFNSAVIDFEFNAIAYIAKILARDVSIYDSLRILDQGVLYLLRGHLSPT